MEGTGEDAQLLLHLWLQRFSYRQLFSAVLAKTVKRAIDGKPFAWDKLERTAAVTKNHKHQPGPNALIALLSRGLRLDDFVQTCSAALPRGPNADSGRLRDNSPDRCCSIRHFPPAERLAVDDATDRAQRCADHVF